jgi:hypothetical protein
MWAIWKVKSADGQRDVARFLSVNLTQGYLLGHINAHKTQPLSSTTVNMSRTYCLFQRSETEHSAHTVYLLVSNVPHNKQCLFPLTINLILFILVRHTSKPNYIITTVNIIQCNSICRSLFNRILIQTIVNNFYIKILSMYYEPCNSSS